MRSVLLVAASAAVASAQLIITGSTYYCTTPGAAYCAGDSLETNIIVRCDGTVGSPGNCNDNLDGYPPIGDNYSPCWQSSLTSGNAACSKNGVVYGSSGNYNGTFTLGSGGPTSATSTASSIPISSGTNPGGPISPVSVLPSSASGILIPSGTNPGGPISRVTVLPSSGAPVPSSNGTSPGTTSAGKGGSATATPVGPLSTAPAPSSTFTGAASLHTAGAALAVGGIFAAYFL